MISPKNPKQFWELLYKHWDDIFHFLNIYLPTFSKKYIDGTELDITLQQLILQLKEQKHARLVRLLNAALWACPDESSGEWAHRSWNVLRVLCTEEWCLTEPLEELES